jgi:hypothetical protein
MVIAEPKESSTDQLRFMIGMILISALGVFMAANTPTGSVWIDHWEDGVGLVSGSITSSTPGYPIWGYSLLAGVLGEKVVFLQAVLVVIVFQVWYISLSNRRRTASSIEPNVRPLLAAPELMVISAAPFVFLSTSYFSNSLAQLFAFSGAWLLYLAVVGAKPFTYYVGAGSLIGLGYHFRSEVLILGAFLFFFALIYSIIHRRRIRGLLSFLTALMVMTIPWIIYTSVALQQPRLSSTNGGAAIYMGLGALPKNPWNIEESDEYVWRIAEENGLGSPWSAASDAYFSKKYIDAIVEHPIAFIRRILIGWRYMLSQGVYIPKFRYLLVSNSREAQVLQYVDQRMRLSLGLNAHEHEFKRLERIGINADSALPYHYVIVGVEHLVRLLFLVIFLMLWALCIVLVFRDKMQSFVSFIFLAYCSFVFFGAGFMQTNPRHTTFVIPALLLVALVLIRDRTRMVRNHTNAFAFANSAECRVRR